MLAGDGNVNGLISSVDDEILITMTVFKFEWSGTY